MIHVEWESVKNPNVNGTDTLEKFNEWSTKPITKGKFRITKKFKVADPVEAPVPVEAKATPKKKKTVSDKNAETAKETPADAPE